MISCDILKNELVEFGKSSIGFCLTQKPLYSVQNCDFEKIIGNHNVMMTSQTLYDTHSGEMINRAKFNVCTLEVLEELPQTCTQTKRQTHRQNCSLPITFMIR